jgi:hypothetical protein
LRDRKQQKVYSGDILRNHYNGKIYVVKYRPESAMFVVENEQGPSALMNGALLFEVIGNVHDNPDLIPGGDTFENSHKTAGA